MKFKSTFPFVEFSSPMEVVIEDPKVSLTPETEKTLDISYPVKEIVEYLWKNKKKLGFLEHNYKSSYSNTRVRRIVIWDIPHNKIYPLVTTSGICYGWVASSRFIFDKDFPERDESFIVRLPKGYPKFQVKRITLKSSLEFDLTQDEKQLIYLYMDKYDKLISRAARMKKSRIDRDARKRLGEDYNV